MKNMKKFLCLLLGLFLLVGCSNNNSSNTNNNKDDNKGTNEELKDPVLEWCQLYNPNGFDTITCVVSNPNKEDIDITYDLVYYKDGIEVARSKEFANFQISHKHSDIIWANDSIPKADDVDEVKMEIIYVGKSYYQSIDAEIKYTNTIGNNAYFSIKHDKKPTLNNVTVFLYNDKNNNNKCDKEELVITDTYASMEKEDEFSIYTDVVNSVYGVDYNKYEIYYNAY